MKHITLILLFLCAASINLFAQNDDPCYGLTDGLREVQKEVDKGNYEMALKMLENMKKDKSLQNCSEMKSGFVDYRINEVKKKITGSFKSCPDNNHPHLIDLGLPSGTKWACCNVDDDHSKQSPTNYGGYYAWGETKEKKEYSEDNYDHYKNGNYVNIGKDIAGTQYDLAHVQWGDSWVMPSYEQFKELFDKCSHNWTTLNGVNGVSFTGPNGITIFLPAACFRRGKVLDGNGSNVGCYWSSTQYPSLLDCSYDFYFNSGGACGLYYASRYYGPTVRPVSR